MKFSTSLSTVFHCSLERAFKTPFLCDVAKVHTGYGLMPKVTHCTEDKTWGSPGQVKKVFVAKSWAHKGGFASTDKVIERIENKYWKIEVANFQTRMLGFTRFEGEWWTEEIRPGMIHVNYTYSLHASNPVFYPLNFLFTKLFWRVYMKRVVRNIRKMIAAEEPYLFD